MLRSTALRAAVVAVAVGLVCVLASAASALSLSQTYNGTTGKVTVTIVGDGTAEWNDMELVVKPGDVVGDFSTTSAGWSVTSVGTVGTRNVLTLTRSSKTKANETVEIVGPTGRGKNSRTSLTLDGTTFTSKTGPGFCLVDEGPGLSPWGLLILVMFLLGAGAFAVTRRRTQMA